MARLIVFSAFALLVFAAITSCDKTTNKTEKYCKHIRCTVVDKDCTKPLKARSFCTCHTKNGKLVKTYGKCPGTKVFNGENDKCEPDSEEARAFCKNQ